MFYSYVFMNLNYYNISPIDNRYLEECKIIREYLSDYGINKIRCEIEIDYFMLLLTNVINLRISQSDMEYLEYIKNDIDIHEIEKIRNFEKKTNHDIKALEYYIKSKLEKNGTLIYYNEFIHFGLTSQDINSVTNTLSIKRVVNDVILSKLATLLNTFNIYSDTWKNVYMISKTHGQPAVTTSMGKEFKVYKSRLKIQFDKLNNIVYTTKFGGAVGNLNAHYLCYPEYNWDKLFDEFLKNKYDIKRNQLTTQVDHYDNLCEIFDIIKRINTILLDFVQDVWLYISNEYFKLKSVQHEIGSSTMPHKINPINFENAEGNVYMANSILSMFSNKLPVSRLQRDLTDSTICRNIGVALSHSLIAYNSIFKGLNKLEINNDKIKEDLDNNWSILAEAIQCVMKTEMIPQSYEIIKGLTRGKPIDKTTYLEM